MIADHSTLSTFSFIFLASLPGKTTFLILLLATQLRPVPVLVGSVLAFLIQSLISVFLGSLFGSLPQHWVNLGVGIIFLIFSLRMWRHRHATEDELQGTIAKPERYFFGSAKTAFLSVFAAEWGDVSQLAIASTAAKHSNPISVWLIASLALALITAMAVAIGSHAHRVIQPKLIHSCSIIAFAGVGLYFILKSLLS